MTVPRYLTDTFAVSPQIGLEDLEDLKAQGFTKIVCNRPDEEVPPEIQADAMEKACTVLGLEFIRNPLTHGALSIEHVKIQGDAARSDGPVLAYCASGNRSSILWSLAHAGQYTTEDILNRTTAAGYNLQGLVPQIEAIAARANG